MVKRRKIHKKLLLIAYDIQDDKCRNKVADVLDNFGYRVNLSVFECMFTEVQYQRCLEKLLKLIDRKTDKLVIYPICLDCFSKCVHIPDSHKDKTTIEII